MTSDGAVAPAGRDGAGLERGLNCPGARTGRMTGQISESEIFLFLFSCVFFLVCVYEPARVCACVPCVPACVHVREDNLKY